MKIKYTIKKTSSKAMVLALRGLYMSAVTNLHFPESCPNLSRVWHSYRHEQCAHVHTHAHSHTCACTCAFSILQVFLICGRVKTFHSGGNKRQMGRMMGYGNSDWKNGDVASRKLNMSF